VPATSFEDMVTEMIDKDINIAERDALCEREGYRTNRYYE